MDTPIIQSAGKCSICGGKLVKMTDAEGRLWAKCVDCNAQFPLEHGRIIEKSSE